MMTTMTRNRATLIRALMDHAVESLEGSVTEMFPELPEHNAVDWGSEWGSLHEESWRLARTDSNKAVWVISTNECQASLNSTWEAALAMNVHIDELEWALAEHGRCDTQGWSCFPADPG